MLRLPKVPYFETIFHRAKDMLKQTYRNFLVPFLINLEFISLWLGTDCVCSPNRADRISLKEYRLLLMLSVFCLVGYGRSRTKK